MGNRTSRTIGDLDEQDQSYEHQPGKNHLIAFTEAIAPAPPTRIHTMTYDLDGALANRTKNNIASGAETQRLETFSYDPFKLIHRYTVRKDVAAAGSTLGCAVDAATQPADEWRYRFGPLQEREQKRQYLTSGTVATDGLQWTYTLLGADGKQLATYNGLQGMFCGAQQNTVWLWPVEYNSYGPASTRVIMRPTCGREYVIHDHLGSARITLNNIGEVVQSCSYRAFGEETLSTGEGARTSYIGREKDNESELGFYGVRMYEPEYGRFMSVDPMWGKYLPLQSYQYAGNRPIALADYSGRTPEDPQFKEPPSVNSPGIDLAVGVLGLVGGTLEVTFGVGLALTPTGAGQIAGGALIVAGTGTLAFSGARTVDALNAIFTGGETADIPTSYGELTGSAVDKSLGGDGSTGGMIGGLGQGLASGFGVSKGEAAASQYGGFVLAPEVADGVSSSAKGLTFIDLTANGVNVIQKMLPPSVESAPIGGGSGGGGKFAPAREHCVN